MRYKVTRNKIAITKKRLNRCIVR